MAAGIENYMARKELFRDIPVCRIVGAFGKYMAEYVFGYIFYLSQGIGRVVKAQAQKRWDPFPMEFVHRKTLGIMGLGTIGLFIAEKAKALGMRVVSWDMARRETPFVDRQYEAGRRDEGLSRRGRLRSPHRARHAPDGGPRQPGGLPGHEEDGLSHQHLPGDGRRRGGTRGSPQGGRDRGRRHRRDEGGTSPSRKPALGLPEPHRLGPHLGAEPARGHGRSLQGELPAVPGEGAPAGPGRLRPGLLME